jgi:hypothetical protein
MVDDASFPHVTWHSHFLESNDYAVVRSFSYEEFESFLESARAILNAFDETKRNWKTFCPASGQPSPSLRASVNEHAKGGESGSSCE